MTGTKKKPQKKDPNNNDLKSAGIEAGHEVNQEFIGEIDNLCKEAGGGLKKVAQGLVCLLDARVTRTVKVKGLLIDTPEHVRVIGTSGSVLFDDDNLAIASNGETLIQFDENDNSTRLGAHKLAIEALNVMPAKKVSEEKTIIFDLGVRMEKAIQLKKTYEKPIEKKRLRK